MQAHRTPYFFKNEENQTNMNKDFIVSELQGEVARIDRALAALKSVEQKRAQHWSQTPEGRKRMSRIMKRRHREALRD